MLGSVGVAIYRSNLAGDLPASVPAADAAVAEDTLGAAVEVAADLPADVGAALLEAARGAFVSGMHLTSAISAVVAVVVGGLAVVVLRRPAQPAVFAAGDDATAPAAAVAEH